MKQINWTDHILNFLAVIIGVSLAFYISSSAERKKERRELEQIITSFIEELTLDKETYDEYQIPNNENQSEVLARVITMLSTGELDSLSDEFGTALNVNNYSPVGITFASISASGKLDLIEDFELRKEINLYHELMAEEARFRGEAQVEFFMNRLTPWLIKNTSLLNPDIEALVGNRELINALVLYNGFIDNKLRQYKDLSVTSGELIDKLNKFLDEE